MINKTKKRNNKSNKSNKSNNRNNKSNKKSNNKTKKFTFIKLKPTNEIKEYFINTKLDTAKLDTNKLLIQFTKNKGDLTLLKFKDINKINELFTLNKNYDIKYDLITNIYEYISMEYINKKYYLDTFTGYDYNKFINKQIFTINDKVFIPLTNFNSNNIYNKKYQVAEMLIKNNLIDKRNKTYLSLDFYGPYEIKNNKLYLYNDLQSAINDLSNNNNNNYLSTYDYESWGMNIDYDEVVHETQNQANINFNYFIQKINTLKDIQKVNNFIFNNNYYKPVDFIYIRNQTIYLYNECRSEYYIIKYLILYLNIVFNTLNNNGTLVINLPKIPLIVPLYNLIYYISTFFNSITYYQSKIKLTDNHFIFKDFNKNKINSEVITNLENITNQIIEHFKDNKLKFNFYNNEINCIENNNEIDNFIIYDLLINKNNEHYIKYNKWFLDNCFNKTINRYKIINKQYDYVFKIPKNKLNEYLDFALINNLNYSIALCNELNFDFNKAYIDEDKNIINKLLTNNEFIKEYFPIEKGINYKELQISRIGLYSISPEYISNLLLNKIYKHFPNINNLVITEANGGIGGDSIVLSKICKHLNVIELDKLHSNIINNNLKVYKRKSFKVYNEDYTKIYNTLKQDIVYFDPPWGGINYKLLKTLDLYLSSINIVDIIINLIKINKDLSIIMKAPYNYNINKLKSDLYKNKIRKTVYKYSIGTTIILFIL